jgi:hypothetical protein
MRGALDGSMPSSCSKHVICAAPTEFRAIRIATGAPTCSASSIARVPQITASWPRRASIS